MSGTLREPELTYRDVDAARFEGKQQMARTAAAEMERHIRAQIDTLNMLRAELGYPPVHIRASVRPRPRGHGV